MFPGEVLLSRRASRIFLAITGRRRGCFKLRGVCLQGRVRMSRLWDRHASARGAETVRKLGRACAGLLAWGGCRPLGTGAETPAAAGRG